MIPDPVLADLVRSLGRSARGLRVPGKTVRLTMALDIGFPETPPPEEAEFAWRDYRRCRIAVMDLRARGLPVRTLRLAFQNGRLKGG